MARLARGLGAALLVLAVGAVLLSHAGQGRAQTGPGVPATPTPAPTAAANEASARSDAASLLGELPLPPGASPSPAEPAGDRSLLERASTRPATPNLVDDHAWWLVPGRPAAVLAYIEARPPRGAAKFTSGSLGEPGVTTLEWYAFAWRPVTGVSASRWLLVTVAAMPNGSTALRADAQVVWVTPRPAAEVIPPGARLMRVSVFSAINRTRQRPFDVRSVGRIDRIVALLNALPAAQPGARSCPSDPGIFVRLAFYARRGAAPLALAVIDPWGCGGVQLTLAGRHEPALESSPLPGPSPPSRVSLIERVDHVLGVHLKVG